MGPHAQLHVVSVLTTHANGGAEFAAVDMLDALARHGARVHLLTNRPQLVRGTHVEASFLDLGPKLRRKSVTEVAIRAPLTLKRMASALRTADRAAPVDVLLLHYKKEQLLSMLLPPALASAVVWAEWGPLPRQMTSGAPRAVYALAARAVDAFIAESEATASSLVDAGLASDRITVVPNVLDPRGLNFDEQARSALRREWGLDAVFVLACMSRLDAAKRIDVAIAALAHLDRRTALVIAGEGEHEDEFRRLAAPLGSRVKFIGGARGRVAQVLSACDAMIYAPGPSEGAARAVTLGQLIGRPVIATAPQGAQGLVTPGTGTIVTPPNDAQALAGCIQSYVADPERVAREGAAARRSALARIEATNPISTLQETLQRASDRGKARRRRLLGRLR